MKFVRPALIATERYSQSMGNCCTKWSEAACGRNYRTNS